jgi:large subunit ribosomal protein L17
VFRALSFGFFDIMNKNVFGRKLSRDKNERKALFKSLMSSLVLQERIQTTHAKAKAIRPEIEKLVTKAKQTENSAKLILEKNLSRPAFEKMIKEIGPRFAKRQGGYTRIIKLGKRLGDDSPTVIIEWVEKAEVTNLKSQIPMTKSQTKKTKETKKPVEKKVKPVKKLVKAKKAK